jgi:hypothetical protein
MDLLHRRAIAEPSDNDGEDEVSIMLNALQARCMSCMLHI